MTLHVSQSGSAVAASDGRGLWAGTVKENGKPAFRVLSDGVGARTWVNAVATNGHIVAAVTGSEQVPYRADPCLDGILRVFDVETGQVVHETPISVVGSHIALVGERLYSWGWFFQGDVLDMFSYGSVLSTPDRSPVKTGALLYCDMVAVSRAGWVVGTRRYAGEFIEVSLESRAEAVHRMPNGASGRRHGFVGFDADGAPVYTQFGSPGKSWRLGAGQSEPIAEAQRSPGRNAVFVARPDGTPREVRSKHLKV